MKDVDLDQIEDWFGFGMGESRQSQAYKSGNADFSGERLIFLAVSPPQLPQGMEDFTAPPDGLDGFDSASSEDAASQQADGGYDGTAVCSSKKPEIRTAEPHGKAVRILSAGREDLVRAARRRLIISTTIWTAIR